MDKQHSPSQLLGRFYHFQYIQLNLHDNVNIYSKLIQQPQLLNLLIYLLNLLVYLRESLSQSQQFKRKSEHIKIIIIYYFHHYIQINQIIIIIISINISHFKIFGIYTLQTLIEKERQCLETFYQATNGDQWNKQWDLTSDDYCKLYGITCLPYLDSSKDQYIYEISLSNNNLTGYLPDCLSEDLEYLDSVYLGYNNISQQESNIQFIKQLSYIDATQANIIGKQQDITLNKSQQTIKMMNNDLQKVTANILNSYILDLTNTSIQGTVTFQQQSDSYRLFLADTQLNIDWQETPQNILFLDAVNSSIDIDIQTLLTKLNGSNIKLINLQGNKIYGLAPTAKQIQEIKQNSLIEYINLADNPFLCNVNGDNMFDCNILEPYEVSHNENTTQVISRFMTNSKYPTQLPQLQLFIKDYEKSNVVRTQVKQATNCSQSLHEYNITLICNSDIEINNASHVQIAIDNMSVSTGSILVNQMIDDMLNRNQVDYSFKNLAINRNKKQIKMDQVQPLQTEPSVPPRLLIQVTAYSQCPDFINIQNYVFTPFSIKYPQLLSAINYTYVSMATYNPQYKGFNATSLHGEYEAYKDLQYICIQEIDKNYLIPTINCDVQGGEKCFENNIYDQDFKQEVRFCMQQKLGHNLLQRDSQTASQLQTSGSPGVFVDGELVCYWSYYIGNTPSPLDCAANFFGDADELAQWLCDKPQMSDVGECYLLNKN